MIAKIDTTLKNTAQHKFYFYCTRCGSQSWVANALFYAGVPNQLGYFCADCRQNLIENLK